MAGRYLGSLFVGIALVATGCTRTLPGLQPDKGTAAGTAAKQESVTHSASTYTAFGDMIAPAAVAQDKTAQQRQAAREEARLSYLKAIEVDPKYLPAHLALARLLEKTQDHAGAVATFNKALELAPENAAVWHELGLCHARQKNWNDSLSCLQKACELNPGNATYQTTLGYTLGRAGRVQEALPLLTQALGEARAHFDLARLMRHMNQPEMARNLAAVAMSKDPNLPGLHQFLQELNSPARQQAPATLPPTIQQAAYTPQTTEPQPPQPLPTIIQSPAAPVIELTSSALPSPTTVPLPVIENEDPARKAMRMPPLPVTRKIGQ